MNAPFLLTWLAGTLLPMGALWLVYRLALRGERCFEYNRALLLLAPLLAAALPLLPRPALPLWLNSPAVAVAASKAGVAAVLLPVVQVEPAAAPAAGWSIWTWLGVIYLAGVALGLGRLAWQVGRLWWLARRLPREARPGYVLAYTGGRLPASSFGRVVFWDETAGLPPAEAAAVLAHELAHVQQRHTSDVLWLEAWRAVLWPNPFAHLLLPALRLTHELLADAAAAPETGAAAYPTLLARLAARQLGVPAYSPLLQPFTFSFTLTRIDMLQNQNPVRRWKQWLVLPALGGLFLAACQDAVAPNASVPADGGSMTRTYLATQQDEPERSREETRAIREMIHLDSVRTKGKFEPGTQQMTYVERKPFNPKPGQKQYIIVTIEREPVEKLSPPVPITDSVRIEPRPITSSGHKIYTYVEQMPQLPGGGGMQALSQAVRSKISYPKAAPGETLPEGRVFASFVVDTDGTVQDVKTVKGLSPAFDEAVLAAIRQLPRFEPGKQNGKAVAVSFTIPIEFRIER
jgi:TonB family protein